MKTRSPKVLRETLTGEQAIQVQLIAERIEDEAGDMQDFTGSLGTRTLRNIAACLNAVEQIIYTKPAAKK